MPYDAIPSQFYLSTCSGKHEAKKTFALELPCPRCYKVIGDTGVALLEQYLAEPTYIC